MKVEETKFYDYVKKELAKVDIKLESLNHLRGNKVPYDSVDRFYALYVIDTMPKLLEIDLSNVEKQKEAFELGVPESIEEEFDLASMSAYNNYEREAMSNVEGYINLIYIAKKGRDYTLKDAYCNGGWFGAS